MATRKKTIQFATENFRTTITDATTTNLSQITVYIPETVISFASVIVDVSFQDIITATGGTITEHRVGLRLGGAAYTTIIETDDIANSGENIAGIIGPFDFTSHFTANWSGTSSTCDIQVYFDQSTGTTQGMTNVNAVLSVTYLYDDAVVTNPTQIKTVAIPFESLVGALTTTTNSNMGISQIPILTGGADPFLPENSVVIRDYYILMEGNTANAGNNADVTISFNIDSGTAITSGNVEGALASDRYMRIVYKPTSVPSTTSSHDFQCWSNTANRFNMCVFTLIVTYEFNASATTRIINSGYLPIEFASPLGVSTSPDASRFTRNMIIAEPGVIDLRQSSFRINFNVGASIAGINFRAGGQSFRTYTHSTTVSCGMYSLQQRIDSGSDSGAGLVLSRGKNAIVVDGYATNTTNQMTNINGYIILNYISDAPSQGIGAAFHTVFENLLQWNSLLTDRERINNYSVNIPESEFWLTGAGFVFYQWVQSSGMAVTFDVECLVGEAKEGGYYDIYADAYQSDNERACSIVWMRGRDVFQRYPNDPDNQRLDIRTARDYRLFTTTTTSNGLTSVITYHAISFTSVLTIEGSTGGSVQIQVFRSDDDSVILETSRVGNGTVDLTWYDNTIDVYADCYEDDSHLGRSALFKFGD